MTILNPTAELLRAAAGVGYLPLGPGVTPVSPIDSEWLAQVAWGYSGVPTSAPSPEAEVIRNPFVYRSPRRVRCRKRDIA